MFHFDTAHLMSPCHEHFAQGRFFFKWQAQSYSKLALLWKLDALQELEASLESNLV